MAGTLKHCEKMHLFTVVASGVKKRLNTKDEKVIFFSGVVAQHRHPRQQFFFKYKSESNYKCPSFQGGIRGRETPKYQR